MHIHQLCIIRPNMHNFCVLIVTMFVWLISHQLAVFFSTQVSHQLAVFSPQNKSATSHQAAVLLS
jgi:hypothetical protein